MKKLYFFFSLNHKVMGLVYMVMGVWSGFLGLALSMLMRLNLVNPYNNLMSTEVYKFCITSHGIVMIFFFLMPVLVSGFGKYFIPLLTRQGDMKLPRMKSFSLWMLLPSMVSLLVSMFIGAGLGWTFYPPKSSKYFSGNGTDYLLISLHIAGLSSVLGSLNFIMTCHSYFSMKKIDKNYLDFSWISRTSIFVWGYYFTAILLFLSIPVLAGAITMLLFDRKFGTGYFDPTGGGDPMMFQHMFWFFGHPEVYVLILPGFGMMGHMCTEMSNNDFMLGYKGMVMAMFSMVIIGFIVWAHHMFTVGMDMKSVGYFTAVTALMGMPTGVKVMGWSCMLSNCSVIYISPMIWWLVSFMILFTLGGMTGIVLSASTLDMTLHDSWFVVAHFHYVLSLGSYSSVMMGVMWWWPVVVGYSLNDNHLRAHCLISAVGFNMCFFPMHYFGVCGLPRRVCVYDSSFFWMKELCTMGSMISCLSAFYFLYMMWDSIVSRKYVMGSWRTGSCVMKNMVWPTTHHTSVHTKSFKSVFIIK